MDINIPIDLRKKLLDEKYMTKHFKFLAPVIPRFVDAVTNYFPKYSEESLENIFNAKIKIQEGLKNGFAVDGAEMAYLPNGLDLSREKYSMVTYTEQDEYNLNHYLELKMNTEVFGVPITKKYLPRDDYATINLENFFANQPQMKAPTPEDVKLQDKIVYQRLFTSVHELLHIASHKLVFLEREDGERLEGKVEKTDFVNAQRVQVIGGIKETVVYYDEQGNPKKTDSFPDAHYLHEGITEYLTMQIFNSKYFDDLEINGKPKAAIKPDIELTYKPFYALVGMSEILHNHVLTNTYFSDSFSKQDVDNIKKIVDLINPLVNSILALNSLNPKHKDYVANLIEEVDELQDNIFQVSDTLKSQFECKMNSLSLAQKQKFVSFYNYFLNPFIWQNYVAVDETNEKARIIKARWLDEIIFKKLNHQISEDLFKEP